MNRVSIIACFHRVSTLRWLIILFSLLFSVICILSIFSCDIVIVKENPSSIPYHTEHFTIYYDICSFTPAEMEKIGARKEMLLNRINSFLETSYDGNMEVFISDTSSASHARWYEQTFETVDYVRNDNGHEISHVVVFSECGNYQSRFIFEGIAVAAEVETNDNAFNYYRQWFFKDTVLDEQMIDSSIDSLKNNLFKNTWGGTHEEYRLAGAFIFFCKTVAGIKNVKDWYQLDGSAESFETAFGFSCSYAIEMFRNALISGKLNRSYILTIPEQREQI